MLVNHGLGLRFLCVLGILALIGDVSELTYHIVSLAKRFDVAWLRS